MFSVPKTTVWHHVHRLKISPKYSKILKGKQGGSRKRAQAEREKAALEADKIMAGPNKYYCVILAMLYWAEGNSKRGCIFTNTNGEMVKMYIKLLRARYGVNRNALSITVRYFTGMNRNRCVKYWSRCTGVNKNKIRAYYNDGGKRGKTTYGICRIAVKKGGHLLNVIQSIIKSVSSEVNMPP
ncbi:MAG: hypothetical protein AAB897_01765 [Patescibacteria group bacterium]